jgi:demethylmenaquinone methyltransferase/2-methoxy-6-polyprenyl-1,4-benzoquinol methylase
VPHARFIAADLFAWEPEERFDEVFFSFWLSHVPEDRFDWFWGFVRRALTPDGRVFFIDNLRTPMLELEGSVAHRHYEQADGIVERHLNDGSTFRAVKVHHEPDELTERLTALGWVADVKTTGDFFYYGCATPMDVVR